MRRSRTDRIRAINSLAREIIAGNWEIRRLIGIAYQQIEDSLLVEAQETIDNIQVVNQRLIARLRAVREERAQTRTIGTQTNIIDK